MANLTKEPQAENIPRDHSTTFEQLVRCPPVFESLLLQLPTDSVLALYHTSYALRHFLRSEPTSWKYLSFRLWQSPTAVAPTLHPPNANSPRPSSNYNLDQLFVYVVNPFSTCLKSLELDNTAVCGMVLSQSVLTLRRETLEHLSVRGCKNVSLKYHINPWLMMVKLTSIAPDGMHTSPLYHKLALKSLYTYRCRHHRRRPYLPTSLTRKDSDSEPTHELVKICHQLGIWTDTAWCTTPGGRCLRRRGYVTLRVPQDPREVWVVYDRLWRSRNWIGPAAQSSPNANTSPTRKRKRDCRSWELEDAVRGEALGTGKEGKGLPAHLRRTHKQFVEDIRCDACSAIILERCEQCSVAMHCSGCRKTLCASCAFDRPFLRNKNAPDEDKNKFWWAPGCAVSPCSMQDTDPVSAVPGGVTATATNNTGPPVTRFKWCCTEPVFSGGGGITFGPGTSHDHDQIRATPLRKGSGWEDSEFSSDNKTLPTKAHGPAGRWKSIDSLLRRDDLVDDDYFPSGVHRMLCDECYSSSHWNVTCKACSVPVCLKHDVQDKLRARICGYKDLSQEKQEFRARQKVVKLKLSAARDVRKDMNESQLARESKKMPVSKDAGSESSLGLRPQFTTTETGSPHTPLRPIARGDATSEAGSVRSTPGRFSMATNSPAATELDTPDRPSTPGSDRTAPPSRSSSPTPSTSSINANSTGSDGQIAESRYANREDGPPDWSGCRTMFCPQNRGPGDHRRKCVAVLRQCIDCKVHVCGNCVTSMGPGCPCKGCRQQSSQETGTPSVNDGVKLVCPNCRWQRRHDGVCKRKVAALAVAKNRKQRYRKPISERLLSASGAAATENSPMGYDDDKVEMIGEFFDGLKFEEQLPSAPVPADILLVVTTENIQELEAVSAEARELMTRIQRLRSRFRLGPLAAAALQDPRGGSAIASITGETAHSTPIVEDMD